MNKSLLIPVFATTLAVFTGASPVDAATYYWNTASTSTWAAGANWSNNPASGGTTGTAPGAGDSAVFNQSSINGTTTANLGGTISVGGITFANTGATTISGGTATSTLNLGAGGLTDNAGAGAVTVGVGTAATATAVNVALAASQTWANNSSTALIANDNITNGATAGTNPYTLTLMSGGTGATTLNGIISDGSFGTTAVVVNGGLNSTGSTVGTGTTTLAGASTYTGGTTVNGGVLTLSGSLASTGTLTMGGGTFNYSKTATSTQSFATTVINNGSSVINNTISADTLNLGALSRTAPGVIDFGVTGTGAITTTTVNTASTGIIAPWAVIGTGTATNYAVSQNTGSSAVTITAYSSGTAISTVLTGATTPTINYTIGNAGQTMSGAISGNTLQVQNTDVTAITLANGGKSLTLNGILNSSGSGGGLTISGTGTLSIGSNNELDAISGGNTTSISSVIANDGSTASSIVVSGGTLSLSGANLYSGGTFIDSGIFLDGATTSAGSGTIILGALNSSNSAYLVSGGSTIGNAVTVNPGGVRQLYTSGGGAPTQGGLITLVGGATLEAGTNGGSTLSITGGVTGTGNLLLVYPQSNRAGTTTSISGGAININGTLTDAQGILGGTGAGGVVTISSAITAPSSGTLNVVVNTTTPGALVLSGANTYTGGTTVTSGAIDFQTGGATPSLPSTGAITVASAGTIGLPVGSGTGLYTSANIDTLWSTGTLSGTNISLSSGSGIGLDTTAGNFTYATAQSTRSLAKFGTGTLTLSGANTYSGATNVYAGTLTEGATAGFSANSIFTSEGGSFDTSADTAGTTIAGLADVFGATGTFALGAYPLTINGTTANTYAGNITGSGAGTLTLSGAGDSETFSSTSALSYSGPTIINTGATLTIGGSGGGGAAGTIPNSAVTINSGGTLTIDTYANSTTAATGIISGTGTVSININNPNRAYEANGSNTFSGTVSYANRGGVILENASALGVNPSVIMNASGEDLYLNGYNVSLGSLSGSTAGTFVDIGYTSGTSSTLTLGGDNTTKSFIGIINETNGSGNSSLPAAASFVTTGGSLVKIGTGTQTLAGANVYTGTTTLNGGGLTAGVNSVYTGSVVTSGAFGRGLAGAGSNVIVNETTAGLVATLGTGNFKVGIGSLTFGGAGDTATSTSNVAIGTGVLNLGGNVTFDATNNPMGSTISGTTGVLELSANRTFTVASSSNSGGADLTVSAVIDDSSTPLNPTAAAQTGGTGTSGSYSLTKAGAGVLVLSGTNTFAGGVVVNAGTVSVNSLAASGSAQELGENSTVILAGTSSSAGILRYTGGAATLAQNITVSMGDYGTINNTGGGLLTLAGSVSKSGSVLDLAGGQFKVNGVISGALTNSDLDVTGGANVVLTANNSYTGPTLIDNTSSLQVGDPGTNSGTTGTLGTGAVTDNGSLTYDRSNAITESNAIGGAGTVTQAGTGTTFLSSSTGNSYMGGTTISAGKVYVNSGVTGASSGTGSGSVTVQSGGTLAGSGNIRPTSGGVTIQSGATLSSGGIQSGTSAGTGLTLDNTLANSSSLLSVSGGATLSFALGSTTNNAGSGALNFGTPNTNSSYLNINGGTIDLIFANTMTPDTINLTDLTYGSTSVTLSLRYQNPYLLIQTAPSGGNLDADFANLVTTGGTGQNGYVLGVSNGSGGYTPFNVNAYNLSGTQLNSSSNLQNLRLYLNNGDLEVVPEPGTWALMLGGLALLIVIQRRKFRS